MSTVSRNDIYVRDENGPEWFNDFLGKLSKKSCGSSIQDIFNAIHNKKTETVESVVEAYRNQVGLDLVVSDDVHGSDNIKTASEKPRPISIRHASENQESSFKPLSIRHASGEQSVVDKIKSDPELTSAIESLCRHSGGTKKIQSLISFLREQLGDDVSFSDDGLKEYLDSVKKRFSDNEPRDIDANYIGLVGTNDDGSGNREDDIADYTRYTGNRNE